MKAAVKCRKRLRNKRGYHCKVCVSVYFNTRVLYSHMKTTHKNEKLYQCVKCQGQYNTDLDCHAHYKVVHTRKNLKCKQCSYRTYNEYCMTNHVRTHSDQKLSCDECQAQLSSASALREHRDCHHNKTVYLCNHCNKLFALVLSRRLHVQGKHRDGFPCRLCHEHLDSPIQRCRHECLCHKRARQ